METGHRRGTACGTALAVLALAAPPAWGARVMPLEELPPEREGPPHVVRQGVRDRKIIQRYVRYALPRIQHCYARELGRHPRLRGRLVLRFRVAASGRVTRAAVQRSTLAVADVARCVIRTVAGIRFPEVYDQLAGGELIPGIHAVDVRYGFRFKPWVRNRAGARGRAPRAR